MASEVPPAGNGLMIRTKPPGDVCARAATGARNPAAMIERLVSTSVSSRCVVETPTNVRMWRIGLAGVHNTEMAREPSMARLRVNRTSQGAQESRRLPICRKTHYDFTAVT